MFDNKNRFVIEDYSRKSTFSSFLPGISGKIGIPIWAFYVNRGQGIACFGVEDKEHSIMEFFPAHQAYQFTKTIGFRTFLKKDGSYYEPFFKEHTSQCMFIGKNELEIQEEQKGIRTNVLYYTLPNEKLGGLVRKVTINNVDNVSHNIELLDGMPAIIPSGITLSDMKEMGQTCKAWMQVEYAKDNLPYYKVRASMVDSVDVHEVKSGHFYFAVTEEGEKLPVIVDPQVVFEYDSSLMKAIGFDQNDLSVLLEKEQVKVNKFPCGFFGHQIVLQPGQSFTIYQVVGIAKTKQELIDFSMLCSKSGYFEQKYREAINLTEELCKGIRTKTASSVFDAYCEQTYLDNILRGGFPIEIGKDKIYYLYSRKHGDMERDYNFFCMLPEYYSQGNANFRDVNQNRRCDVVFAPFIKDYNIKVFYNLLQIDGYNPLAVQKETYRLEETLVKQLESWIELGKEGVVREFFKNDFTPGSLLRFGQDTLGIPKEKLENFLEEVINLSQGGVNADFCEGYWTDHWTYNLDLLESYLSIYPEEEEYVLFHDHSYTFYESRATVNPRKERYVETERGIRQYNPINKDIKKHVTNKQVRCEFGKGEVYTTTLIEKLVVLCATKFATLDPYGLGIEMEAGKPGWYDALNGLPGIFGSSMAETFELYRLIEFVVQRLEKYQIQVMLAVEVKQFVEAIPLSISDKWRGLESWNAINLAKETYREQTTFGVDGKREAIDHRLLTSTLIQWLNILDDGIARAKQYGNGIVPTYFSYEVTFFDKIEEEIVPKEFSITVLPYFLEGPVRYLKLSKPIEEKKELYHKVKESNLYDEKLSMYKVNTSLKNVSYEVGRATAFSPGWLENESIWLHMEYKYLLELLKSGLYEEYFEDSRKALIPFLKEEGYGRSILENSSFIASSVNPDKQTHGKGFVARLSGSTAEFVQMWQIMMFGEKPFRMKEGKLTLSFRPAIPSYLIPDNLQVETTFLGQTAVMYQFNQQKNYIPGSYAVVQYEIMFNDTSSTTISGSTINEDYARKVRAGEAVHITIYIE